MTTGTHIYCRIDNKTNFREICKQMRDDVRSADDRDAWTELNHRAGYLTTLSHASSWEEKFGDEIQEIRNVVQKEFAKTARTTDRRAEDIGTDSDYEESWGN
ncbi:MAG: hypothetical protein KDA52_00765 [Planctomycetaceae bacterium]|nr:hypothetical protein [Planctomycetaceae bacterium]